MVEAVIRQNAKWMACNAIEKLTNLNKGLPNFYCDTYFNGLLHFNIMSGVLNDHLKMILRPLFNSSHM